LVVVAVTVIDHQLVALRRLVDLVAEVVPTVDWVALEQLDKVTLAEMLVAAQQTTPVVVVAALEQQGKLQPLLPLKAALAA
jgi:hypothetical protein